MTLQRFDLNLLKTLLVLDEERNIQRAAARLFVTPSAVSHALARLRQVLADPIFVRSGLQLVPTSRCTAVVMAIRPLLGEVSQILDASVSWDRFGFDPSTLARTITVVMPGALELSLLPRLATTMTQQASRSKLVVRSFERRSYEVDLASGEADIVLSVGGHTPAREGICRETLWEDELVALQGRRGRFPATQPSTSTQYSPAPRFTLCHGHNRRTMWIFALPVKAANGLLPCQCPVMAPWGIYSERPHWSRRCQIGPRWL
jgi:DNA-binding transcriptional LysR family regulator